MQYCTKCGAPNSDEAGFCQKCGNALAGFQTGGMPAGQPTSAGLQSVQQNKPVKRKRKKGFKVILIAAAIILFFALMGNPDGNSDRTGEDAQTGYEIAAESKQSVADNSDRGNVEETVPPKQTEEPAATPAATGAPVVTASPSAVSETPKPAAPKPSPTPVAINIDTLLGNKYDFGKTITSSCLSEIPGIAGSRGAKGWFDENGHICWEAYDYNGIYTDITNTGLRVGKGGSYTYYGSGEIGADALDRGSYSIEFKCWRGTGDKKYVNETFYLYVYHNGEDAFFCQSTSAKKERLTAYLDRRKTLLSLMEEAGVTPETSLNAYEVFYPTHTKYGRCDTKTWAEFSHTLVEDDWDDHRKVQAFYNWIIANLAYDDFVPENTRREYAYEDYSGKWSTWDTGAGVCWDFSHIFLIMCRENGIPCVTLESVTNIHEWNAVWLDGRWYEFDVTWDVKSRVPDEDISEREDKYKGSLKHKYYGNVEHFEAELVNGSLCTEKIALGEEQSRYKQEWYKLHPENNP